MKTRVAGDRICLVIAQSARKGNLILTSRLQSAARLCEIAFFAATFVA